MPFPVSLPGNVLLARALLAIVFLVSAGYAFRFYTESITHTRAERTLTEAQRGQAVNLGALVATAGQLVDDALLEGDYTDFREAVITLAFARELEGYGPEQVLSASNFAVENFPYRGTLWARRAIHLGDFEGVDRAMLDSLDRALQYGRTDYQSMRLLSYIAVRHWPQLDCSYQDKLLAVIDDSLVKNDHILMAWNTQHGHTPIGKYVTELMSRYGFDESWARTQVRVCLAEQSSGGAGS